MRLPLSILTLLGACLTALTPAAAQLAVSAMVEDVEQAPAATVAAMDFVRPGQRIALGAEGRLTLSYLTDCRVETIQGGIVIIGRGESRVDGGSLDARRLPCDLDRLAGPGGRAPGATLRLLEPFDLPAPEQAVLSTLRPIFRWRGPDGAEVSVLAAVPGSPARLVWSGSAPATWLEYPENAPALEPGLPHVVRVQPNDGAEMRARFVVDPALGFAETLWNRTILVRD